MSPRPVVVNPGALDDRPVAAALPRELEALQAPAEERERRHKAELLALEAKV